MSILWLSDFKYISPEIVINLNISHPAKAHLEQKNTLQKYGEGNAYLDNITDLQCGI